MLNKYFSLKNYQLKILLRRKKAYLYPKIGIGTPNKLQAQLSKSPLSSSTSLSIKAVILLKQMYLAILYQHTYSKSRKFLTIGYNNAILAIYFKKL